MLNAFKEYHVYHISSPVIFVKTERVTYLHHVDDVVGQPKQAEGQHDGQDKLLTTNATAKLGLSDPA